MTPNYTVTDDSGRVWTGEGADYVVTKRGEVQFCSLREDDEILDYGRKCKWVVTPEAARVNVLSN
jgi:hypothetical protein